MRVAVDVTDERIGCLLCGAFESGPAGSPWARIMDYREPEGPVTPALGGDRVYRHIDYPLAAGGAVVVRDCYAGDESDAEYTALTLDREACERGLILMAQKSPRHWGDFLAEDDDAITADIFLQYALLGDVVYG